MADHNDSVESNLFFYEEAFTAYKAKFPGVDKPAYMAIAQGKDQAFCLFQPNPAQTCLDVGDKFKSLGLAEPARDAYVAGLLSEGVNGDKLNIRFWSGMAQLHFDWQEYEQAKPYLTKVLEVEKKNKWAKKMLASIPREADARRLWGLGAEQRPAGLESIFDLHKLGPILSARGYGEADLDAISHGNRLRSFSESLPADPGDVT